MTAGRLCAHLQRSGVALGIVIAAIALLPVLLPTPHFEARLFSDDWGAENFTDPNFCVTPLPGQPPRMPLFDKAPAVASALDRLSLALRYLGWGLLLPLFALVATLHRRGIGRHPGFLILGLLGAAPAYFMWPFSPVFVGLRQALGTWLVEHWTVTEHLFVWIDGAALLFWLLGGALLFGGATFAATWAAARSIGIDWRMLAHALPPLAAATIFLGLTQESALYLRGEGANLDWLPGLRAALLVLAIGGTGWLGARAIVKVGAGGTVAKACALLIWMLPLALVALHGWLTYFHWMNRFHV